MSVKGTGRLFLVIVSHACPEFNRGRFPSDKGALLGETS